MMRRLRVAALLACGTVAMVGACQDPKAVSAARSGTAQGTQGATPTRTPESAAPATGKTQPMMAATPTTSQQPAAPSAERPQAQTAQWLTTILQQIQGAQSLKDVPSLIGKTQNEAAAALEKAGLRGTYFNTGHADWRVAAQNPAGGQAKARSNVDVTMGPVVPPLNGMTIDAATSALIAAGLQMGSQTREGTASYAPVISKQYPASGSYALQGSGVAVWLPPLSTPMNNNASAADATKTSGTDSAQGSDTQGITNPDVKTMPSVLTLSYKQAASILAGVGVVPVALQGRTRGTVQEQSVPPGTPVRPRDRVTLTMGIVVPDVEGLSLADAELQLKKAGLNGVSNGDAANLPGMSRIVVQQIPEPNAVATNPEVMLTVQGALGPAWWVTGVVVLGLVGWGLAKIVKTLMHAPPPEFSAKVNGKKVRVTVAPKIAFELRAKRDEGELRVLRSPKVKSVSGRQG